MLNFVFTFICDIPYVNVNVIVWILGNNLKVVLVRGNLRLSLKELEVNT